MPAFRVFTAAVFGRYLGVVGVLEQLLLDAGIIVEQTWAADGSSNPLPAPVALTVVPVVTLAPGDPTLATMRSLGWTHRVVAVTWHPLDELDVSPGPTSLVRAGTVRATLAATVRTTAAAAATDPAGAASASLHETDVRRADHSGSA